MAIMTHCQIRLLVLGSGLAARISEVRTFRRFSKVGISSIGIVRPLHKTAPVNGETKTEPFDLMMVLILKVG
jgi:hypothetical protein